MYRVFRREKPMAFGGKVSVNLVAGLCNGILIDEK